MVLNLTFLQDIKNSFEESFGCKNPLNFICLTMKSTTTIILLKVNCLCWHCKISSSPNLRAGGADKKLSITLDNKLSACSLRDRSHSTKTKVWDFFDPSLPLRRQFIYQGLFTCVDILKLLPCIPCV